MDANQRKNIRYSLILLLLVALVWAYRNWLKEPEAATLQKTAFTGKTMGTSYSVVYLDEADYQPAIDSLLQAFNQSLSTYIPESEISRLNREALIKYESPFFYPVLKKTKEIYTATKGAFDPTVGPLVNAWGFGPEGRQQPSDARIDSLLQLVSFDSVFFDSISVCKMLPGMQLDFSAIAKGYGVDVVFDFLRDKGIENIFVEIGGEVRVRGVNAEGKPWRIGINTPSEDLQEQQQLQAFVDLYNRAIATSGNYRNYYELDGKKFSHTISPKTGRPVRHSLLSASVFAPDCMTADAYATACMVLGTKEAQRLAQENPALDMYLIYADSAGQMQTWASAGIREQITVISQR